MCAKFTWRCWQGLTVLIAGLVLLISFYLQYTEALEPCPLCLMQRGMTGLIFLVAGFGFFALKLSRRCVLLGLEALFAMSGAFFALRQLWLQSLPVPDTGMCLPGIELLLHKLPWDEIIHAFVWGTSTGCGDVSWLFLGFSMAAWSLLYFSVMIGIVIFSGFKLRSR